MAQLQRGLARGTRAGLHEAWQCYRGDLLEGLSVGEAPFDHWLQAERKRVRALMTEGLSRLLALEIEAQHDTEALQVCTRLLALDPLREEAIASARRCTARCCP